MTLNRPDALNALTAAMSAEAEAAFDAWREDDGVRAVILDAAGERAFCAGGDIAELYERGMAGDYRFGQDFWRQEYRLNLKIRTYPKPVVAFMQGYTMGGGVGFGCHAGTRIVGQTSRIAMPECAIGLIPDVGGSWLLGRAPGHCGVYLGLTGARMGAGDAIHAGFADRFVPEAAWEGLKAAIVQTGDVACVAGAAVEPAAGDLARDASEIDAAFGKADLAGIAAALEAGRSEFASAATKGLSKGSPLSMACALEVIRRAGQSSFAQALALEYRFSARAQESGDFLEGIRAQIIDRDFAPNWRHKGFDVAQKDVAGMLAPLGADEWDEA